ACSSFCFCTPSPACLFSLSLRDALPILSRICFVIVENLGRNLERRFDCCPVGRPASNWCDFPRFGKGPSRFTPFRWRADPDRLRSEEHTSELQSREKLVCRLLLAKKNEQ